MRSHFDEQLAQLNSDLMHMGALCEEAIVLVTKVLSTGDKSCIKKIKVVDTKIDQKEQAIEALCLRLLLQQQPVARDLRQISAALKMITDMERIGDQAEDIAKIVMALEGCIPEEVHPIYTMERAIIKIVTDSIEAYVHQDMQLASSVIAYDDIVDDCFRKVKKDLIQRIAENRNEGEKALDLLMIAKYFERIGDHAVNIAEWVQFSILGHHLEG